MNRSKDKGSAFEREAVKVLTEVLENSEFKRIPTSGAIGTTMNISYLTGDIVGTVEGIPKQFRLEAKVGYSNKTGGEAKSFNMKKEWLDKINKEATNTYSIPVLICKFDNVRSGVKYFVALDIDTFSDIINSLADSNTEANEAYIEIERLKNEKK